MRITLLAFILAFVGLGTGYGLRLWLGGAEQSHPSTSLNQPRSEFHLNDLEGKLRSIAEWDGKVIVLNFWATWCPPCRKEIPAFVQLQTELGAQGVQFIGVAIDEIEAVRAFSDETGINYPLLIGGADATAVSQQYGNHMTALPFTALVGRDGRIVHARAGEFTQAQMRDLLLSLL
jgi:peroxiredoxin